MHFIFLLPKLFFLLFFQINTEQKDTFWRTTYIHNKHRHTVVTKYNILHSWVFRFWSDSAIQSYVKGYTSDRVYGLRVNMILGSLSWVGVRMIQTHINDKTAREGRRKKHIGHLWNLLFSFQPPPPVWWDFGRLFS